MTYAATIVYRYVWLPLLVNAAVAIFGVYYTFFKLGVPSPAVAFFLRHWKFFASLMLLLQARYMFVYVERIAPDDHDRTVTVGSQIYAQLPNMSWVPSMKCVAGCENDMPMVSKCWIRISGCHCLLEWPSDRRSFRTSFCGYYKEILDIGGAIRVYPQSLVVEYEIGDAVDNSSVVTWHQVILDALVLVHLGSLFVSFVVMGLMDHGGTSIGSFTGPAPPDRDRCAICRDDMNMPIELWRLKCTHVFHAACIQGWLRVKSICPLCRASGDDTTETFMSIQEQLGMVYMSFLRAILYGLSFPLTLLDILAELVIVVAGKEFTEELQDCNYNQKWVRMYGSVAVCLLIWLAPNAGRYHWTLLSIFFVRRVVLSLLWHLLRGDSRSHPIADYLFATVYETWTLRKLWKICLNFSAFCLCLATLAITYSYLPLYPIF